MSGPLEELKRDIEEENLWKSGLSPRPLLPTAEIELDRLTVPRGENLVGMACITAGSRELWLDRVALTVNGVAKTAGSRHGSVTFTVTRHVSIAAGETRRIPLWVPIPLDTELGSKMMLLVAGRCNAAEIFEVEPESHYVELGEELARATGMELQEWADLYAGDGVFGRLRPTVGAQLPLVMVGIEMHVREGRMEGALILDAPCRTMGAVLRSLVRSNRRRIPFSFPIEKRDGAGERLLALLQAHLRKQTELPIPAKLDGDAVMAENLPIPTSETEE
jgi:hypothetical protein